MSGERQRALVLLSGGLDSTVAFKWALDNHDLCLALTFDYGQRAALREMKSAQAICRRYGVRHRFVTLEWMADITHSALVRGDQPLPHPESLDDRPATEESARAVWVPNRNGLFANIAACFAEAEGIALIVAGFNAEEAATFPDNSAGFVDALNASLQWSTLCHPTLISPTLCLTKEGIVRLAREIEAPLDLVWACYAGEPEPCWECESCRRLKRALVRAKAWEWYKGLLLPRRGSSP